MAGLGETTARLAAAKRRLTSGAGGHASGGHMTAGGFSPNPGGLRMLSYAPADLPAKAPLVVVLHGCTQAAEGFAHAGGWLDLADRLGFAVLAPEQNNANNPNRCFRWFEPEHTTRGHGEVESIRAMTAEMVKLHDLDDQRVFVTGLSAGGAMTAAMLACYPEVFAGGAIIAGLPYGSATDVMQALGAMHSGAAGSPGELGRRIRAAAPPSTRVPRVMVWHGDADHTVVHRNGAQSAVQWAAAHGLAEAPSEVQVTPGRRRLLWRAPDTGEILVESNLLEGLSHGVALSTGGPEGVGTAAPFMLEAGVSSTWEILRFWNLAPPSAEVPPVRRDSPPVSRTPAPGAHLVGDQVMASLSGRVPDSIRDTIEGALQAAGLRKPK